MTLINCPECGKEISDVYGIVVNAFSEPFVLPREYFDIGAGIPRE